MKFCNQCRYFVPAWTLCGHPGNRSDPDPVMGTTTMAECHFARSDRCAEKCGPEGKWWEQIEEKPRRSLRDVLRSWLGSTSRKSMTTAEERLGSKSQLKRRAIQAGMNWEPLFDLDRFLHDTESRASEIDDKFTLWVESLDPKHWARYDLSACALGWNAAVDAIRSELKARGIGRGE